MTRLLIRHAPADCARQNQQTGARSGIASCEHLCRRTSTYVSADCELSWAVMETTYNFEEMDEFLVSRYLKERGVPDEYAEKLEGICHCA